MSQDESWIEPDSDASVAQRVERLEAMARAYHELALSRGQLGDQVRALRSTGEKLDQSVSLVGKQGRALNRIIGLGAALVILVVALGMAALLYLTEARLGEIDFRSTTRQLCEQRNEQASAIQLFVQLEVERSQRSTLLSPKQIEERVDVLRRLGDFTPEDCDDLSSSG